MAAETAHLLLDRLDRDVHRGGLGDRAEDRGQDGEPADPGRGGHGRAEVPAPGQEDGRPGGVPVSEAFRAALHGETDCEGLAFAAG